MTTEAKPRQTGKIVFWLTVMLACDFGLWQTAKIAYEVAHHETAQVTSQSAPAVADIPTIQERPENIQERVQTTLYLQEGSRGAIAFAQRAGRPVQDFANYVHCNVPEWFIMTAYVLKQNPTMNREAAAANALIVIQNARKNGVSLSDIVQ